jgi:hypothetical protein
LGGALTCAFMPAFGSVVAPVVALMTGSLRAPDGPPCAKPDSLFWQIS